MAQSLLVNKVQIQTDEYNEDKQRQGTRRHFGRTSGELFVVEREKHTQQIICSVISNAQTS